MKSILFTLLILIMPIVAFSQEDMAEEKKKTATFATKIVHNSVAGFAPFFFGNFQTNHRYSISVYSIFWTNPSFGNLPSGSDLLLETGVGIWYPLLDNSLVLNPGIGLGHGKFSSSVSGTRIAESIIPNLYIKYNKGLFDFEGYIAYYKALRDEGTSAVTKDYLLQWAAPGIKVGSRIVLGLFYESFGITQTEDSADAPVIYQWLGGSIKLNFDKGIAFRFSAGPNLRTDVGTSNEFYKVSSFIPF